MRTPSLLTRAAFYCVIQYSPTAAAEQSLSEIVDSLNANEALDHELDVRFEYTYDAPASHPASDPAKATPGQFVPFGKQSYDVQFVRQRSQFRAERRGQAVSADGSQPTLDRVRAFDGTTTRLLEQNAYGNIIRTPLEDENCLRPHMMLLYIL